MAIEVSIVTVCLNDGSGLERTIDSVRRQTLAARELIVVDGGSTDRSLEVLRRSDDAVTCWSSRPDHGVFDAQNQGARRARGEWLVFLNAGDRFATDDALELALGHADGADVLYGDVIWEKPSGECWLGHSPARLTFEFLMRTTIPHQATLVRRTLFERLGPFDTSFQLAADYAFFLKTLVTHGARARYVPAPLAVQLHGGRSTRDESFATLRLELQRAREAMVSPVLRANYQAYLRARRGLVATYLRDTFRPVARRLRAVSRKLRHKPDCYV